MEEPETAKKIDWRAHGVSWTTEPFTDPVSKHTFDRGAIIRPLAKVRHGKSDLFVTVPNASGLFLNLSRNFHNEAADAMRECLAVKGNDRPLPDEPAYSFFEKMMGSVVFACAALEAFVILLSSFLPDREDLRKFLKMENFDNGFGGCGPR